MKAFLKGASEAIDFETQTVKHFLDFESEDGRKFQIPSSQEATQALVQFLQSGGGPVHPPRAAPPSGLGNTGGSCPECGYPDTNDGNHYKGIYTHGIQCPYCGFTAGAEPPEAEKVAADDDDLDIKPVDEFPAGAGTFGGDGGLDDAPPDEPEEAPARPFGEIHDPTPPKTEEEVPSL